MKAKSENTRPEQGSRKTLTGSAPFAPDSAPFAPDPASSAPDPAPFAPDSASSAPIRGSAECSSTQEPAVNGSRKRARKRMPYPPFVLRRLVHLRRKNQLTQREVAACLGVRQQTYCEYEHGQSPMHIEEFILLARLFDVSVDFITGASNLLGEYPRF